MTLTYNRIIEQCVLYWSSVMLLLPLSTHNPQIEVDNLRHNHIFKNCKGGPIPTVDLYIYIYRYKVNTPIIYCKNTMNLNNFTRMVYLHSCVN